MKKLIIILMTTLTLFACTDTEVGKIKQVPTPTPHAPYVDKPTTKPTPRPAPKPTSTPLPTCQLEPDAWNDIGDSIVEIGSLNVTNTKTPISGRSTTLDIKINKTNFQKLENYDKNRPFNYGDIIIINCEIMVFYSYHVGSLTNFIRGQYGTNPTKHPRKSKVFIINIKPDFVPIPIYQELLPTATPVPKPTATPIPTWGISKIIDGDTFDIKHSTGEVYRVRILGIDTPEIYSANTPYEYEGITNTQCLHAWGLKATEFAINTLLNKSVTVITDPIAGDLDIYDRLLRYVEVDGKDFSAMILENGYARVYTEAVSSRMNSYLAIEEVAKMNKVGLWGCSNLSLSIGSQFSSPSTSSSSSTLYNPFGPDRNCKDFELGGVDAFFKAAGGPYNDPHGLDADGDGYPCENNILR
tara:strand:- start:417 stop:1652 length:1236 start_codon:yes stop_codon:yes gene_type:complete